jgi:tetratricopeptide (TPR) repeat protein
MTSREPFSEAPSATRESTLDIALDKRIRQLCAEGYRIYDERDYEQALRRFYQAWTLIPKPQTQFEASGWVLTAIGDAYFAKQNYRAGIEALRSALYCPRTTGNPFVHLRLGQCCLEQQLTEDAERHLARALYSGGEALFSREARHFLERARVALQRLQSDRQSAEIIFLGGDWQPGQAGG